MMKTTSLIAALCAMVALSACNTAKGVGRDVKSVGEAVSAKDK